MPALDAEVRALVARLIAEDAASTDPGAWPLRHFRDQDVLFLGGNDAYFWLLGLDGRVWAADHDTVAMRLEEVTDPDELRDALAAAARRHPALACLGPSGSGPG